jgi:hypothetical protein
MEDDVVKSQKEVENLRQDLHESEQLRQEMQEDYRKAVADCMAKENENVELVQKLASAIKEIHQLQVSNQTHDELIKDLNNLLVNGEYADCFVQIGSSGERIALHRAILATRSHFFKNLINIPPSTAQNKAKGNNAQSSNTNVLNLDNMTRDNANQILEYVYCGKCRTITDDESAKELYETAERLGFASLKDIVVDYYVNKLDRDNCIKIASRTLYIQNNSEKYKEYIKDFIVNEGTDLIESNPPSEQWRRLKQENPSFAVELLEKKIEKDERKYKKLNAYQDEIGKQSDYSIEETAETINANKSTIVNSNNNNKSAIQLRKSIK